MIVLGPEKLPEVAASVGKWIREFRRATEELTSQFADENPFTEIQKALALDDLLSPTVISFGPDSAPPTPVAPPVIEAPATVVAPVISQPTVPEKVKSYHFFGTPNHPGLDPEWIVGAPIRAEVPLPVSDRWLADDEWLHGVPVVVEPPAPASDQTILDQILSTAAELEATDSAAAVMDTNGHDSAATLEGLSVEAIPSEVASEEVAEDAPTDVEDGSEKPIDATEILPAEEAAETAVVAVPEEPVEETRSDVTLILEPAPEVRHDEARQEPAFVGGDAKGRISEEHQP